LIITIRVSDLDGALIKRYAAYNKETVSSILKRLIMEQIESDYNKLLADRKPVDLYAAGNRKPID
jgi:helix-turn-helix protein